MRHVWRKHSIPLGTRVAFKGDSTVYVVADYQSVLECTQPCDVHDSGDCYPEPFISVKQEIGRAFPLSTLETIFLPNHHGRPATENDKKLT